MKENSIYYILIEKARKITIVPMPESLTAVHFIGFLVILCPSSFALVLCYLLLCFVSPACCGEFVTLLLSHVVLWLKLSSYYGFGLLFCIIMWLWFSRGSYCFILLPFPVCFLLLPFPVLLGLLFCSIWLGEVKVILLQQRCYLLKVDSCSVIVECAFFRLFSEFVFASLLTLLTAVCLSVSVLSRVR